MTRSRMRSPPPSWSSPPEDIRTAERLTRAEMTLEEHSETLDDHGQRHDEQATWNRAFSVALAGLTAGLAHAKADGAAEFLAALLKALRP